MPNEFNFSRTPFVNDRAPRLVFGLALVAVAALTATHGYFLTRSLLREQEELDVRVKEIHDEIKKTEEDLSRDQADLAKDQSALADERTSFLVRLYRRKSFSWTGLFNELEAITPPSVRVTSISPLDEKDQITVTLTVVGRTLQDVLEMVRALESSSFFATVFPVDEENLEELSGQGTGIAATLKLEYVESASKQKEPSAAVAAASAASAPSAGPAEPAAPADSGSAKTSAGSATEAPPGPADDVPTVRKDGRAR